AAAPHVRRTPSPSAPGGAARSWRPASRRRQWVAGGGTTRDSPQRSRTRRAPQERDTQISMQSPARRSTSLSTESRWSGSPSSTWRGNGIRLDPSLPPQLTGVTVSALHWQGRVLRVSVGPQQTEVSLLSGSALSVDTPSGARSLAPGAPLV